MFVLVADRSLYPPFRAEAENLRAAVERGDADAAERFLTDPAKALPESIRAYGPFNTYDEGKAAAMLLPFEADYWVLPLESLTTG